MNPFDEVFDEAWRDGILVSDMPNNVSESIQRDFLKSIHNGDFNNWLEKKFEIDLNAENYGVYCIYDNFKIYLKEYYADNKRKRLEGLAARIEKKMEVGLLPDTKDILPDLHAVVEDVESYAHLFEPHYTLFVNLVKRGGLNSIQEYISLIFYEIVECLDISKLVESIDVQQFPKNDLEIMEMAQVSFANAPIKMNEATLNRLNEFALKVGELTPAEENAQYVIHVLMCKLFINRACVVDTNRLRKSMMKIFLEQYYREYSSLLNRPMPPEIIQHLQNIRVPQFDIALKEMLDERGLTLPTVKLNPVQVNDKSEQSPSFTAHTITIHNAPVTQTTTNTMNGSGGILNSGEMTSSANRQTSPNLETGRKSNRFWVALKQWWWAVVIPVGVTLLGLYGDKHHWFE